MNKKFLKIHGLRKSGTNFLEYILKNNLENVEVLINAFQHKHNLPNTFQYEKNKPSPNLQAVKVPYTTNLGYEVTKETINNFKSDGVYIFIVKNPFAYYQSMAQNYNWLSLSDWNENEENIITDRWNIKNKVFYRFHKKHKNISFLLTYIKFLKHTKKYMSELSDKFDKIKIKDTFKKPEQRFKGGSQLNEDFDADFYLKHKYMNNLSDSVKEKIKNDMDKKLINKLDIEIPKIKNGDKNE